MLEQSRGAPDTPNLTSPLTLSELCDMYTAYVKERYPKDSQYNYRCMVLWVTKDYGEHPAGDLNGSQIDGLQQKMVAEDLTRRYINDITKMVKRMYKWAYGRSHVPEATYRRLEVVEGIGKGRLGARDNPPIRPVSDDVIEKTVRQLPTLVAAMVRFQRLTGCRPQDVCNLNEAEIDRTEDIWVYRPSRHKRAWLDEDRAVAIGPKAQSVLKTFLQDPECDNPIFSPTRSEAIRRAEQRQQRKIPPNRGNSPGSNVKLTPKRNPGLKYSTDSYRRAIQRGCANAGVDRWSPNQLRHTAATDIRRTHGLEASSNVLGHKNTKMTETYAERDLYSAKAVAREVG